MGWSYDNIGEHFLDTFISVLDDAIGEAGKSDPNRALAISKTFIENSQFHGDSPKILIGQIHKYGKQIPDQAIEWLLENSNHPKMNVREVVARQLRYFVDTHPNQVIKAVMMLETDPEVKVKEAALSTLSKISHEAELTVFYALEQDVLDLTSNTILPEACGKVLPLLDALSTLAINLPHRASTIMSWINSLYLAKLYPYATATCLKTIGDIATLDPDIAFSILNPLITDREFGTLAAETIGRFASIPQLQICRNYPSVSEQVRMIIQNSLENSKNHIETISFIEYYKFINVRTH
jgi:hypothetical protein